MLGMLFRGVFLIGVLGWYSTNVWKLIDGYFRDQFRNYLEEEYRKNPRMKADLQAAATAGKADPIAAVLEAEAEAESTVALSREILETCERSGCPVETAANDSAPSRREERKPAPEEVTGGGTSENGAASDSIDKNAFLGTTAESKLETGKSSDRDRESPAVRSNAIRRGEEHDPRWKKRSEHRRSSVKRTKGRSRLASPGNVPSKDDVLPREAEAPRKRTVKTITLTKKDFVSVQDASNDDFWEFEEDADEREPLEGILVSQLPFKPTIDGIGDLERVTADEYCPLTLEDEASCGETVKWP